jgi:hypothetical protein
VCCDVAGFDVRYKVLSPATTWESTDDLSFELRQSF